MQQRIRFFFQRLHQQLWLKPFLVCLLSIVAVFMAKLADHTGLGSVLPSVQQDSIHTLLSTMSASMLVIATFAVGSMVTSYASASSQATPRSFSLVIADDVSQNALSTFIGSFIYSIVGLIALDNGYYEQAGLFALFALTVTVFAIVILTFVRWLDRIARLGRIQTTIEAVEAAARKSLLQRKQQPRLQGLPVGQEQDHMVPLFSATIGYLQCIEMSLLQEYAQQQQLFVRVAALPGAFCTPDRPIAYFWKETSQEDSSPLPELDTKMLNKAFIIDSNRTFDDDPRFGLVVLSEIANKALSPAVNDHGTAIHVIGSLVRVLFEWIAKDDSEPELTVSYDRIQVPEISVDDMLDDAFSAISRDGAGSLEVAIRLQKGLNSLSCCGDKRLTAAANKQAATALQRASNTLELEQDKDALYRAAGVKRPKPC